MGYRRNSAGTDRRGATTVEMAVVLPVFLLFVFGMIQYGHTMMVSNYLRNAVRESARYGSTPGITNEEVIADLRNQMASVTSTDTMMITIRDATSYDLDPEKPTDWDTIKLQPEVELFGATSRQLFVVRASVKLNDVALVKLPFIGDTELFGQAFMRHE